MSKNAFYLLPEKGDFSAGKVITTIFLFLSVFIGIGQIPLYYAIVNSGLVNPSQSDLANYLGSNYFLTLLFIPFVFAFLALIFALQFIHKTTVLSFFTSREKFDWKRVGVGFLAWFSLLLLSLLVGYFADSSLVWNYQSDTFWMLVLIGMFILPIQTTCEELIFRSFLFKNLTFLKSPYARILICGTLFGLMHGMNPEIEVLGYIALVFYIWNGFFLGILTHFDNGLELSIGYHAVNNMFAAILVTNNWQALQTDALLMDTAAPALGWEIVVTMFVFQPLLLLFFNSKYKWNQLPKK